MNNFKMLLPPYKNQCAKTDGKGDVVTEHMWETCAVFCFATVTAISQKMAMIHFAGLPKVVLDYFTK